MLNEQVSQYIPSSLTDVRQASAALFASWARMFGKLTLSVGARYEYVDYDFQVNGKRDEEVSRCDHLLTPDVSLIYSFNDDAQICLSYKLATVKPPYSQLTSSLSYTGLHEIEGGNPALRDEKRHDVQLFGCSACGTDLCFRQTLHGALTLMPLSSNSIRRIISNFLCTR